MKRARTVHCASVDYRFFHERESKSGSRDIVSINDQAEANVRCTTCDGGVSARPRLNSEIGDAGVVGLSDLNRHERECASRKMSSVKGEF